MLVKTTRLFCITITIFLLISFTASAQTWLKLLHRQNRLTNKVNSLFTIEKAFNDYWGPKNVKGGYYIKDGKKTIAPGWKLFKEWDWYWRQRVNPVTGEFPSTNALREYKKSLNKLQKDTKTLSSASWTSLGPSTSAGGYSGLGRINCITFDPSDANTYWVGTPSGGIWKTTDNGTTWTILNNNQAVLGVSDIAVPPDYSATHDTIYIATGDRDGGSLWSIGTGHNADNESIGVLKSTDGGSTWNTIGLTFTVSQGYLINRLLIDPSNYNIIYAATNVGIFKSTDGGTNWGSNASYNDNNPFLVNTDIIDIEFKPGDSQTIYASTMNYSNAPVIYRTTDGGASGWNTQKTFSTTDYRTELAVSPANSADVYAVVCKQNGSLSGIYKSTNSGGSFSLVYDGTATNQNLLGYNYDASDAGVGQGSYDLCLAVSPSDSNTIFLGGINTWASTDGGSSWTLKNIWSNNNNPNHVQVVHADKHALAYQSGTNLFEGCDGGLYLTTDGGTTWTDKTNGMVITQIYRMDVSQTNSSLDVVGCQDNGAKGYSSGTWTDLTGGDGTTCLIDYNDPNYWYTSYVQGKIYLSINSIAGFSSYSTISGNIPGGQPTGAWVTPFIMDQNNSQIIYAGYLKVYKTTDRGTGWTDISSGGFSSDNLNTLAISPSNSNYIYAADFTHIWKTTDGGTSAWSEITNTLPVSSASITNIQVSATDPNTLWVTFGGYSSGNKVFESDNAGGSWTNISGSLPNLPVLCIRQNKRITAYYQLFVGTDEGVYAKDGANDWINFSDGLPNVVITDLRFYYDAVNSANDRLRAASFGRGMWETPVSQPLPVELTTFKAVALNNQVKLNWSTATETNSYGFDIERTVVNNQPSTANLFQANEIWTKIGFVRGSGNSNSPKSYSFIDNNLSNGTNFQYKLKMIDNDGNYKYSNVVNVTIQPSAYTLMQNHPNPFNPTTIIEYELPVRSKVLLNVYDILGNKVATLVNEVKNAGKYKVQFNGADLASGIYFYELTANNNSVIKKMILMK